MNKSPHDLLRILKEGIPHRCVYETIDKRWCVDYGGGEFSASAVEALVKACHIKPVYSSHDKSFHIGKTMDEVKTRAARREHGKHTPPIYVE